MPSEVFLSSGSSETTAYSLMGPSSLRKVEKVLQEAASLASFRRADLAQFSYDQSLAECGHF